MTLNTFKGYKNVFLFFYKIKQFEFVKKRKISKIINKRIVESDTKILYKNTLATLKYFYASKKYNVVNLLITKISYIAVLETNKRLIEVLNPFFKKIKKLLPIL